MESLNRQATQDNILILFREHTTNLLACEWSNIYTGKLREGLVASKRRDQFAVEGTPFAML